MPQGKPPGFGHEDAARCYSEPVQHLERISINPDVMGGKPCIRGMRVTVGMIVEALAAGRSVGDLLADFPYLEERDIRKAPAYASGLAQDGICARQLMRLPLDMNRTVTRGFSSYVKPVTRPFTGPMWAIRKRPTAKYAAGILPYTGSGGRGARPMWRAGLL